MDSDSFERGGQPRSVPDPDAEKYEAMIRLHNQTPARRQSAVQTPEQSAGARATLARPTLDGPVDAIAAGIAHVLNSPREARKEIEQGHVIRGLFDGVTAAADLEFGGSAANGIRKGYVRLGGPHGWKETRRWLGEMGLAEKYQHMHHALIPNGGWGKVVPDVIKNQPWNFKAMESPLHHVRVHGNSRKFGLPKFNALEQYWHGTPKWWKAANASAAGHSVQAIVDGLLGYPQVAPPDPQSQQK